MSNSGNPATPAEWERQVYRHGIDPVALRTPNIPKYNSASQLTAPEFLHLKVLWKSQGRELLNLLELVNEANLKIAQQTNFVDFTNDLQAIRSNNPHKLIHHGAGSPDGLFSLIHYYTYLINSQKPPIQTESTPKVLKLRPRTQIHYNIEESFGGLNIDDEDAPTRPGKSIAPFGDISPMTPATPSSSPRTDYEAIVNMSLVSLLCAIRLRTPQLGAAHWLPDPKPFVLRDQANKELLEARVDGYLRRNKQSEAFAILEVQPYVRSQSLNQIQWQESAQMAAWISQTPSSWAPGVLQPLDGSPSWFRRRLLVPQDRDEIFIIIGEYDAEYETHITDGGCGDPFGRPEPSTARFGSHPDPVTPTRNPGRSFMSTPGSSFLGNSPGFSTPARAAAPPASPKPRKTGNFKKFFGPKSKSEKQTGMLGLKSEQAERNASRDAYRPPTPPAPISSRPRAHRSGFLTMSCYGPFSIQDDRHMGFFCQVVVALTLQVIGT